METAIAINPRSACAKCMRATRPRPGPSNAGFKTKLMERATFDAHVFLNSAGMARKVVNYGSRETVFLQGSPATSVLYIQEGGVKLTAVDEVGRETVVAILVPGDFLGEGCLGGQLQRVNTATTITPTRILVLEKPEMIRVLHAERALADRFIQHLLSRLTRVEEDLIDQRLHSSEKRLARTLLLLAHCEELGSPKKMLPKVSQEVLAEMIGTTRSRVNFFMNKFRKLGFIDYNSDCNGEIRIKNSLLGIVLN
jgi:CRP/FNR family transcriptional regulator, cyclic AMP receptor protein